MSPLLALVRKEFVTEYRQQHSLFGALLYVAATVFMIYLLNGQPDAKSWNALFWVSQLFIAVNAVARSFLQESPERFRYYYTIARPSQFFIAKLLASVTIMAAMNGLSLLLFALFLGAPFAQTWVFIAVSAIGGISLAALFTFLSAIAARAQQNVALMAILGFPIAAPLLMMLSKLALAAIMPVYQTGWWMLALVVMLFAVLIVTIGFILFPFLWQE